LPATKLVETWSKRRPRVRAARSAAWSAPRTFTARPSTGSGSKSVTPATWITQSMLAPRRSDDARIDPAERVAHVARDHVEPRGEEVAQALSMDLAEVAEAGAPLEEVSHARRGGLGLLAAREDRDPPDLRRALEQHADEHLADEAREARDEHVLAAQRRAHRERPGVGPVGLGARASFLQPSFDHRAIAPSSVSRGSACRSSAGGLPA
jgi:hypothetical protein